MAVSRPQAIDDREPRGRGQNDLQEKQSHKGSRRAMGMPALCTEADQAWTVASGTKGMIDDELK